MNGLLGFIGRQQVITKSQFVRIDSKRWAVG
jgi:hypothetical protein